MPRGSYNAADSGEGHGTDSKTRREAQHSGGDTAWSRWSRLTAVCEMLLCVLLLTAITVLWINYHILKTKYELQTSNNNLTVARDQLQTCNNNLNTEREQFQRERTQLQRERDELQRFLEQGLSTGWNYSSSSVYIVNIEQKTWTESRESCRVRGANLVIINSTEEQEFVNKLRGGGRAWIGLSNRENKWKWVDDTTLITGFWASEGPNSAAGKDRCVVIGKTSDPVKNWGDDSCNEQFKYICEKKISN
ncbi:asialoglycoprotein receptor 2-like isoform 1-T3 [Clarias gariepinus]|uniref:C-type lectin domain family 4 member E-like n=1 Tax=Clarias gariepinus TaxID=13013 RepID=UPI00234E3393|nr:C-type lectin domain family 4 member E-like [Clarias gariepinus]